jgi:hypothetical protein
MYHGLNHQIAHQSKDNLNNKSLIYLLSYQSLIDYFYMCSNTFNTFNPFWNIMERNSTFKDDLNGNGMTESRPKLNRYEENSENSIGDDNNYST